MTFAEPSAFSFHTPHAFLPVNHGRVAYWRFGQGPDIFAVHGWPLHAATFRNLLPYLVERFTVHLIDLPGTGQTEWNGPIGFETNAAVVQAAADAIGLTSYALVAHDSGGVVARLVASNDPRVLGLVLIGSEIPRHHSALLRAYVWSAKVPGMSWLFGRLLDVGVVRRSAIGYGTCFENPRYCDGDFFPLFVAPLRDPRAARGQLALLGDFDFAFVDKLEEVHAKISAPTLCIWGARDPFFPIEKARAMLPQFKGGAALEEIPNAKLFPHEDYAGEVAAFARPFLDRCLEAG